MSNLRKLVVWIGYLIANNRFRPRQKDERVDLETDLLAFCWVGVLYLQHS